MIKNLHYYLATIQYKMYRIGDYQEYSGEEGDRRGRCGKGREGTGNGMGIMERGDKGTHFLYKCFHDTRS